MTLRTFLIAFGPVWTAAVFGPRLVEHGPPQLVRSSGKSSLYHLPAPGYAKPILLADLQGTHEEMGFDLGKLLPEEPKIALNLLFESIVGAGLTGAVETWVLNLFMDWQWKFQEPHIPADYLAELRGIERADAELAVLYRRGIVISSLAVGDVVFDIEHILTAECRRALFSPLCPKLLQLASEPRVALLHEDVASFLRRAVARAKAGCSQWGVWGDRTVNGQLFSGRNLDWLDDTGIADYKLLTVFHPPAPQHAHVTVGFAGVLGALSGMSVAGVTVHESGNDNLAESPTGMPWTLRLRHVMEHAGNLSQVRALWLAEDNMLGVSHGFGSAADAASGNAAFLMTENKGGYTAFFEDDDPRESQLVGPSGTRYGYPLQHAVWRTNHGYDPTWLATAPAPYPDEDTFNRYMLLHDTIQMYGESQTLDFAHAVNLSAIVTDKGGTSRESFLTCDSPAASQGIDTISAAYAPATLGMYVSFEEGRSKTGNHLTGGCSNYVFVNMQPWLGGLGERHVHVAINV